MLKRSPVPQGWVGIDNYVFGFEEPEFWNALKVTVVFVTLDVLIAVAVSLGLALLLRRAGVLQSLTRAVLILPFAMSPALIGVRMSVERRADGRPYIKLISTRSINDPFLALLVELTWAQGRLVREYTALIDPPGYTPAPVAVTPPGTLGCTCLRTCRSSASTISRSPRASGRR